jgi:hypothetical protein
MRLLPRPAAGRTRPAARRICDAPRKELSGDGRRAHECRQTGAAQSVRALCDVWPAAGLEGGCRRACTDGDRSASCISAGRPQPYDGARCFLAVQRRHVALIALPQRPRHERYVLERSASGLELRGVRFKPSPDSREGIISSLASTTWRETSSAGNLSRHTLQSVQSRMACLRWHGARVGERSVCLSQRGDGSGRHGSPFNCTDPASPLAHCGTLDRWPPGWRLINRGAA